MVRFIFNTLYFPSVDLWDFVADKFLDESAWALSDWTDAKIKQAICDCQQAVVSSKKEVSLLYISFVYIFYMYFVCMFCLDLTSTI